MWIVIVISLLVCGGLIKALLTTRTSVENAIEEVNRSRQEKSVMISFFHELGAAFTKAQEIDEVLQRIAEYSMRTTGASATAIFFLEENGQYLRANTIAGVFPPLWEAPQLTLSKVASRPKYLSENLKKQKISLDQTIIGEIALSGQPMLIQDASKEPRIPLFEEDFLKVGSLMAAPLKTKETILGVMVAVNKTEQPQFTETDLSLFDVLADQAAVSVSYTRLYQNLAEKERLDRELQIATEIQNLLLPKEFPSPPGFEISAMNYPALEVGGDYFDFIRIDKTRWGIVVADVSGKGIPAALVMVMCRSILRSIATGQSSASNILSELNSLMHPDLKSDMFISILFMILDSVKKTLTVSRAGHEPVLYFSDEKKTVVPIRGKGIAIGIDKGPLFVQNIEDIKLKMKKGDVVVLYTDGVTEAIDENNNEFERENLVSAIKTFSSLSASEISNNIQERIRRFTGDRPQRDDLTLVVIKAK